MSDSDTCRVKVVCRVRPLNEKEHANGSVFVVGFPSETSVALKTRLFQYDHVLQPDCSQLEVYTTAARPLVKDVLSGYNATIFAYGQTASGKTHTMEGVINDPNTQGIIPRIIQDMFDHIYSMDPNLEIHIKVAYFELYMEKIRDLLDVTKFNLPIGETKNRVPYVKGVTERFVTTPEEVLSVIEEGKANRHVSVTNMNAHSSRSHAVFLISIKQENKETRKTLMGKLYLVDLAGSEKVDKTNAQGLTLDEAKTINKSLLSLSNVISALAEFKPFIPYRDSKLTRVLQESLGGNARTTLIICCSPSSFNEQETKTTLMFGDRAKTIKNKVAVNIELTAEEWRRRYEKMKDSNQKLRALIEKYEGELARWRGGESVPESEQSSIKLRDFNVVQTMDDSLSSLPPSSPLMTLRGPASATPTTADIQAFESERAKLCQQLDEKDEDLQAQTELVEKLTLQLHDLEDTLEASQKDNNTLKKQIMIIEQELVNSQEEVHEVMQALEELAVSYDSKDREIGATHTEKQLLAEEMEQLQQSVDKKSQELSALKDMTQSQKRKHQELLSTLFHDLNEVGSVLGAKSDDRLRPLDSSSEITDEDFTRARIHLSNLRCEARTLAEQRDILEQAEREAKERAQAVMKELSQCRLKISQYETQNEVLHANLRVSELKKQEMESSLGTLHDQLLTLKGREQTLLSTEYDREQEQAGLLHSANQMKRALEEQLDQHRDSHQKYVEELKEEIWGKETQIAQLTGQYQSQTLAVDMLRNELVQLQQSYDQEKERYSRISMKMKIKERTKQDLGGITDTMSHELDRLNQLRQNYIQRITRRMKSKSVDEDHISPGRREISFLERNLEELTRAHKRTISENAEMQREIPRLHAVLASKSKRIGELEHLMRETKDSANKECDRLREENEKLQKSFMERLKEKEKESQYSRIMKRQSGPSIARPVPRKGTDPGSSREALLAVAGVAVIGQRQKPPQLTAELDSSSGAGDSSTMAQATRTS